MAGDGARQAPFSDGFFRSAAQFGKFSNAQTAGGDLREQPGTVPSQDGRLLPGCYRQDRPILIPRASDSRVDGAGADVGAGDN